jgi:hypothetical protein
VLEPRLSGREAELISDGGGLAFAPRALGEPPGGLDPEDPAVAVLVAQLSAVSAPRGQRMPWKRRVPAPESTVLRRLEAWRQLARTDDEVLFGRGQPPALHTAAIRRDRRRRTWGFRGDSAGKPLRAARDGIRASSWRLDPTRELLDDETTLRILVTEQAFGGGQKATGRVLAPDLHMNENELVLRLFVTPLPGFKMRTPNPETPVRVALPEPIGSRRVIDGALFES